MGPWLEEDDKAVFNKANELVLRQELLAQSNLACDQHYTLVKLGYGLFSTLTKDTGRSVYKNTIPKGMNTLSIAPVPNQAWDLVNKATETIWVDPPQPDVAPLDDSEEASAAAEMAERFLVEDGKPKGTDDVALMMNATDRAMTCATSYIEGWVDPVGGGYVPLQINAHPDATSPDDPLVGPDGMPTTDPILRYVTRAVGGQFTNDPSQAAQEWQPRIVGTVWPRENWRIFPETETVAKAEKVIGLLYCTLGQAKRRWESVAAMSPDDLSALLAWQPPRYLVLLPPYQRNRFQLSGGSDKEKSGSSDERIMFYYKITQRACPESKHGAEVIVTGAFSGGRILSKRTNAATLDVPSSDGTGPKKEVRCLGLSLVQVTPRDDPDERNPQGRPFIELFCGATEFDSALVTGYLSAMNTWLNPDSYVPSTSTVQGYQVEESRATGDAIPILRPEDKPAYGNMPPIPANFWEGPNWNQEQIRSIASLEKAVTGSDTSKEVSGVARQVAVQRGMVGISRMQRPCIGAYGAWCDVKVELAMRDFPTEQTIRYVGEDESWKATKWKGTDFALVGSVGVQAGTGTMMTPEVNVNYISTLIANGLLPQQEGQDAARPVFSKRLGISTNPHENYVQRCIDTWLEGPPDGKPSDGLSSDPNMPQAPTAPGQPPTGMPWVAQWKQYMMEKQQYDQAAQATQAAEAQRQAEHQHAQTLDPFVPPRVAAAAPMAPPPQSPWTPFEPRPNETEPAIAQIWMRRLSNVMSTVKYSSQPVEWRQCLDLRYEAARQVVGQAQAAQQPAQPAQSSQPSTGARSQAQTHTAQPPRQAPHQGVAA